MILLCAGPRITAGSDGYLYVVVTEGGGTERIVRFDGTTGPELDDPWVSVGPGVPMSRTFYLEGNRYVSEGYIGAPKAREFDTDGTDLGILIENDNFGVGAVHIAFYDPGMSTVAGDANGDGLVDVADRDIVGLNFNAIGVQFGDGDFNGDGRIDVADLGTNWGGSQTASLNILIPEPATVLTLNLGLFCFGIRRRSSGWR
ncbi:MAG: hypothetical protein CMJ20_10095 [Phycisphaeraceae bacterium]|nr:hypothetical protein [Phycisphaeraceae bacterium]